MKRIFLSRAMAGVLLLLTALACANECTTTPRSRPAIAPPTVSVPDNGHGIVLPSQESPFTTSWEGNIPGFEKVFCRAFDLDMNRTLDVIFCWKDGKLVFRQWLNNTSSYETFLYDQQDGSLVSKKLYLSASEPEGYQFSFEKLALPLVPPDIDSTYTFDKHLGSFIKQDLGGSIVGRFALRANGTSTAYWQQAAKLNAVLCITLDRSASRTDGIRTELITARLPKPVQTLYKAEYTSGGLVSSLSNRIWPSPAFYCDRPQANYQFPLYVVDKVQYGYTEMISPGMPNACSIHYMFFDQNKDGNPERVYMEVVSNGQVQSVPLSLTDANSNGLFEGVELQTEEKEVAAVSTKDDGTYDVIRTRARK